VSFARNFWNYVVLDFWDRARGREKRIAERSVAVARADLEVEYAAARERKPYLKYVAATEEWKKGFTAELNKLREGAPHRRVAWLRDELTQQLPVPPVPRLRDAVEFQVCGQLFVKLWEWREAQFRDS
jgi:hypothetical protein